MPESQRKRRQRERQTREDELVESIRRLASTQAGVTVDVNPASDFETLGFNVQVPPQLTDAEIVDLGNQLLEYHRIYAFEAGTRSSGAGASSHEPKIASQHRGRDAQPLVAADITRAVPLNSETFAVARL